LTRCSTFTQVPVTVCGALPRRRYVRPFSMRNSDCGFLECADTSALSKRRHVAALQCAAGAAYSEDVAPERSFGIFCDAFLHRCQPYGLFPLFPLTEF
jgi:hypothetical protein